MPCLQAVLRTFGRRREAVRLMHVEVVKLLRLNYSPIHRASYKDTRRRGFAMDRLATMSDRRQIRWL